MRRFVVLFLALIALHPAQSERTFHSIVVEPNGPPNRRGTRLVDYNSEFAWVSQDFGDSRDFGGGSIPGVFVHSHAHNQWLKILQASTAGARFGKSPPNAMLQAPWDFTNLGSREFVPLPLMGGSAIHLPDEIVYDSARQVFVLYFDSFGRDPSMITTLIIPKKDLLEAFDYYGKRENEAIDRTPGPGR